MYLNKYSYLYIVYMEFIVPAVSMLVLDGLYLSNVGGPMFGKMVKKIQSSDLKMNVGGAVGAYTLMLLALYKFILLERRPPSDAFLLGLCIYGVFDFTNYAIFTEYEMMYAGLVDMVWGGILYYIVTWVTYKVLGITRR
jgi:uncharacterized membrane protein